MALTTLPSDLPVGETLIIPRPIDIALERLFTVTENPMPGGLAYQYRWPVVASKVPNALVKAQGSSVTEAEVSYSLVTNGRAAPYEIQLPMTEDVLESADAGLHDSLISMADTAISITILKNARAVMNRDAGQTGVKTTGVAKADAIRTEVLHFIDVAAGLADTSQPRVLVHPSDVTDAHVEGTGGGLRSYLDFPVFAMDSITAGTLFTIDRKGIHVDMGPLYVKYGRVGDMFKEGEFMVRFGRLVSIYCPIPLLVRKSTNW